MRNVAPAGCGTGDLASTRRRACGLLVLAGLAVLSGEVAAARWRSLECRSAVATVAIASGGRSFNYSVLDNKQPALLEINGARRLKITTRYLYAAAAPAEVSYTLAVQIDGREVLRKVLTARPKKSQGVEPAAPEVSAIARCYVDMAAGTHAVEVRAETDGQGRIAARFFRAVKISKPVSSVAFTPDRFAAVYHLQFASGSQSRYYHFDPVQPLAFTVTGPTTVKVYTRLDFDHTMNGRQHYSLDVAVDGQPLKTYHYDTGKLSTAIYVERTDILPGTRKTMRLSVPAGTHTYTIRCLRPDSCGVAAAIRIPKSDLLNKPR
jgi:hypothetical protein